MSVRRVALAIAAGLVFASGLPPRELALASFAYAPMLLLAIEGATPWQAARLGFVSGVVFLVPATHWVARAASEFGQVPPWLGIVAEIVLVLAQSLTPAVAACVASVVARRGGKLFLALPATVALSFAAFPAVMPWHPGFLAVPWLDYAQCLDLVGITGLDLLCGLAGCAALETVRRQERFAMAVLLLTLALPLAYGIPRRVSVTRARARAASLRVGIAQPDVSIALGRDPNGAEERVARMHRLERALAARGAALVLFPESTYPHPVRRVVSYDVPPPHGMLADGVSASVVVGALTTDGPCGTRNSILAVDDARRIVGRADKVRPFPFADEIPGWDHLPFLHTRFPCRGLARTERPHVLAVSGTKLGPLVCYDSVDAWPARSLVLDGAELLTEHTNDAWYGRSDELHMHARVARLRAIEVRRDLVRATNTGFSEHVDATGAILTRLPPFVETSAVVPARLLSERTVYARFGDVPAFGAALAILALCRRRPSVSSSRPRWKNGKGLSKSSSIDA